MLCSGAVFSADTLYLLTDHHNQDNLANKARKPRKVRNCRKCLERIDIARFSISFKV
jgi:hypothetical protein